MSGWYWAVCAAIALIGAILRGEFIPYMVGFTVGAVWVLFIPPFARQQSKGGNDR